MVKKLDFRRNLLIGKNMSEINIGIIGHGKIGKLVSRRLKNLGANLMIFDPKEKNKVTLEKSFKVSDVITFHLPLTKETKNLIGIQEMKNEGRSNLNKY